MSPRACVIEIAMKKHNHSKRTPINLLRIRRDTEITHSAPHWQRMLPSLSNALFSVWFLFRLTFLFWVFLIIKVVKIFRNLFYCYNDHKPRVIVFWFLNTCNIPLLKWDTCNRNVLRNVIHKYKHVWQWSCKLLCFVLYKNVRKYQTTWNCYKIYIHFTIYSSDCRFESEPGPTNLCLKYLSVHTAVLLH